MDYIIVINVISIILSLISIALNIRILIINKMEDIPFINEKNISNQGELFLPRGTRIIPEKDLINGENLMNFIDEVILTTKNARGGISKLVKELISDDAKDGKGYVIINRLVISNIDIEKLRKQGFKIIDDLYQCKISWEHLMKGDELN